MQNYVLKRCELRDSELTARARVVLHVTPFVFNSGSYERRGLMSSCRTENRGEAHVTYPDVLLAPTLVKNGVLCALGARTIIESNERALHLRHISEEFNRPASHPTGQLGTGRQHRPVKVIFACLS